MEEWGRATRDQQQRALLAFFSLVMPACRMRFDASGRLTDFGMDGDAREVVVDSGKPFQTSGCPGMITRFPPAIVALAGGIRSFPFAFNGRDVALEHRQIQGNDVNIYDEAASKMKQ